MVYFLFVVAISLISLPSQSIETSEVEVEVAVGTVNDVPVSHRSSFHNDLTEAADFVNYYETYSFISEQKVFCLGYTTFIPQYHFTPFTS